MPNSVEVQGRDTQTLNSKAAFDRLLSRASDFSLRSPRSNEISSRSNLLFCSSSTFSKCLLPKCYGRKLHANDDDKVLASIDRIHYRTA